MNEKQLAQFQTAQAKLEKQDLKTATDILLSLYDQVDDRQVILLLGKTLVENHQFVSANRLVDDNFAVFLQYDFDLLFKIYLRNHRYLQLVIIANGQTEKLKQTLLKKIQQSEKEYEAKEPVTVESKSREFMHLGAFPVAKQREVIGEAETLPVHTYLTGAKINLLDRDVNPIWRMQLLNNLMRLKVPDPVDFLWIDGNKKQIIPNEAMDVDDTKAFHAINQLINETIGQDDPIKATQLHMTIKVDLQVLFPYIDEIITAPESWLRILRQKMFDDVTVKNFDADVVKWLKLIDSIMKTLIN